MSGGDGWVDISLGDILTLAKRPVAIEDERSYEQVTVRIRGRGLDSRGVVTGERIATKKQYEVWTGDLLVSKIDARNGGLGLVPERLHSAIVSGDFPAYTVDASLCLPEYLDLYVRRPAFWDECLLVSEGSTNRVRLVPDQFLELDVQLPPLEVQRRVAEAVVIIDRAAAANEQVAAATQLTFRCAREQLLATDNDWEALPAGWSHGTLGEVAEVKSGITKGRKATGVLRPTPFIRAANVQDGWLDIGLLKTLDVSEAEVERFRLAHGDILMTEGGNSEHVGRGWMWEAPVPVAVAQNHVFRVRVNDRERLHPRYLAYAIGARPAREYCHGCAKKTTNLASINKTQVTQMPVPVPPLPEQRRIIKRLDELRAYETRVRRVVKNKGVLRASLIEDFVTGVREPPGPA